MSDGFSARFGPAIATWAGERGQGPLRHKTSALRAAYAQGANSVGIDPAAYLTVRAPATFASITAALNTVAKTAPDFAPKLLCDVGAGPGTASFAAAELFASLTQSRMIEPDSRFADLAQNLAPFLPFAADVRQQSLLAPLEKSDLLIAAYVLAEIPLDAAASTVLHLWQACEGILVLVEPGTPQGFARIRLCRDALLQVKAHIIGPCTHDAPCPIPDKDWCHFKQRLARSRQHMHAKSGTVPFEDEAYSWLAVARFSVPRAVARIVGVPKTSKTGIALPLCSASGLTTEIVASRDKLHYKQARKLKWGEGFSP